MAEHVMLGKQVEWGELPKPGEIILVDAFERLFQLFKVMITSQPNDLGMTELVERYG